MSPLRNPSVVQTRGESARARGRPASYVYVAASEAIVVDEELAARASEIAKEIDERVAGHE